MPDAPQEPDAPIVDEEKVEELRSLLGDGPEGVDGLVDTFVDRIPEVVDDLRHAAQDGETEEIANLAHKVKGESATLGAQRLSLVAKRIEDDARADELAEPTSSVELLVETYEATEQALLQRRDG